jgi:hypothetical protein
VFKKTGGVMNLEQIRGLCADITNGTGVLNGVHIEHSYSLHADEHEFEVVLVLTLRKYCSHLAAGTGETLEEAILDALDDLQYYCTKQDEFYEYGWDIETRIRKNREDV